MEVSTKVAHGNIRLCGSFNLPGAETPGGVNVNEQTNQHPWRILCAPGAPVIKLSPTDSQAFSA
jgi:hypothetical protein